MSELSQEQIDGRELAWIVSYNVNYSPQWGRSAGAFRMRPYPDEASARQEENMLRDDPVHNVCVSQGLLEPGRFTANGFDRKQG